MHYHCDNCGISFKNQLDLNSHTSNGNCDTQIFICLSDTIPDKQIMANSIKNNITHLGWNNLREIAENLAIGCSVLVGLVWKSAENDYHIPFLDQYHPNVKNKYRFISDSLRRFLQIAQNKQINLTLDLITCNLNSDEFKKEMQQLESDMDRIIVRYSLDATGNSTNWVLESDGVQVRDIYFTSDIEKYPHLLDSTVLIDENNIDDFPEFIYDRLTKTYIQVADFIMEDYIGYNGWNPNARDFVLRLEKNQKLDGRLFKIFIPDGNVIYSLIDIAAVSNKDEAPIILNLIVTSDYPINIGAFCDHTGLIIGNYVKFVRIENCEVKNIAQIYSDSGAIAGKYLGYDDGCAYIRKCKVRANRIISSAGGICSSYGGSSGGYLSISDCEVFVDTDIVEFSSGICSGNTGYQGEAYIDSCKVKAGIITNYSSGICGEFSGSYNGLVKITNCEVKTNSITLLSAGIVAQFVGVNNGECQIDSCRVCVMGNIGDNTWGPDRSAGFCRQANGNDGNDIGMIRIENSDLLLSGDLIDDSRLICNPITNLDLTLSDIHISVDPSKRDIRILLSSLSSDLAINISIMGVINEMIIYAMEKGYQFKILGPDIDLNRIEITNVIINGIPVTAFVT